MFFTGMHIANVRRTNRTLASSNIQSNLPNSWDQKGARSNSVCFYEDFDFTHNTVPNSKFT
jgi:hypothetical protein